MPQSQFSTFTVHGHLFGVQVEAVQEVIRYQVLTRVPLAPPSVGGLMNLRGQVITAVDLRCRLGFPTREGDDLPMNVVVRTEEGAVTLLVDKIGDVVDVSLDSYEPIPDTLLGTAAELIKGAYKLQGQLLLELNVARAVEVSVPA
ncbi:MAG: chemotaxis protein CheW [Actinomycetota bacterium]|nr:chemotaxis protein CheW [Actinomycetota bacterium]